MHTSTPQPSAMQGSREGRGRGCLCVTNALTGNKVMRISHAEFPDTGGEENEHDVCVLDVLFSCGIPRQELALCDLLDKRGHLYTMGDAVPWRQGEDLHLRVVQNRCPRCTVCGKKCRRMSPHVLCSHGCTKHLWQCAGQAELSLVDGYLDGAGLETLSLEMVQAELAAIRREQNTAGTELSRASTPQPSAMQGGRAHQ